MKMKEIVKKKSEDIIYKRRELPRYSYEVIRLPSPIISKKRTTIKRLCGQQQASKTQKDMPLLIGQTDELRSKVEPKYPSFTKTLVKSHVSGCFWMGLPQQFCRIHLPSVDTYFILENENGKQYRAKYLAEKAALSGGWRKFSIDEKLTEGDVLVFQLVSPTKFKVRRRKENGPSEAIQTRFTLKRFARVEKTQKSNTSVITDALVPEKTKDTHRASPFVAASQDEDHTGILSEDDEIVQTVENVEKNTLDISPIHDDYNGFKTFDDFISGIEELLQKDYTVPNHIKWSYYQLCASQKSVLHADLLKGVNPILLAGCINETVYIANEIKGCDLPTFDSNFSIWEQKLKSLKGLGMNVGFLSARLLHLRRIACNPETANNRQHYMDVCFEYSDSEKTIKRLEDELNEQRRVSEKLANDMKRLNADIEERELKFQEQVSAPWCDPSLVL